MPTKSYNANGITSGFNALSRIFAPDPTKLIQADLARQRRDALQAQMELRRQQTEAARAGNTAHAELAKILSDPAYAATSEGRARAMSLMPRVQGGLQHGPRFAVGANTFVNPDQFDRGTLSTMLAGTGENYANTPQGFADKQQNNLEREQIRQTGAGQRRAGVTMRVDPKTSDAMWQRVGEGLKPGFDGWFGDTNIPPEAEQVLRNHAANVYQSTRNADLAIQSTIEMAKKMPRQSDRGLLPWNWGDDRITPSPEQVQQFSEQSGMSVGAPAPAAPAPAPAPAPPKYTEGMTMTNPQTGERIQLKGNQWVPVK